MKEKEKLIKSRKRVKDFAEVYTPSWLVGDMVNLVPGIEGIYATVLEPSCGNGNFLIEVLNRKLELCENESDALSAIGSLFGVDIQTDNVLECRERLFQRTLEVFPKTDSYLLRKTLERNILPGDFLTRKLYKDGKETDELIWFLRYDTE